MEKKLELKHEIRVSDGETTNDEYVLSQSYKTALTYRYLNTMTFTRKELTTLKDLIEEKLIRS